MTVISNSLKLVLLPLLWVSCSVAEPEASLPRATSSAPPEYGMLLKKYAGKDGVRYRAWHASASDREALGKVIEFYARTRPPEDRDMSLAWHLNAYNANILEKILNKYPTSGPLDKNPTFFHLPTVELSGRKLSFNHLEQKLIRPVFNEPRIHFALNCASESCPPLHDQPFSATTLDVDLEKLTRRFINENPQAIVLEDKTIRISNLFKWYADDFGGEDKLIAYINQYRDSPLPSNAKFSYLDYSWKLNESE